MAREYTIEEKFENLLRRGRMASEVSLRERLMRQKNAILQRQLEVNLQILEREDKSSQKHMDKAMTEYGEFLYDLPQRWRGLEGYTQPNTRELAKIRERNRKQSELSGNASPRSSVTRVQASKSTRSRRRSPRSTRSRPWAASPHRSPQRSPSSSPSPSRPRTSESPSSTSPVSSRRRQRSSPSPKREKPKFTSCIEVLDDIINNHILRQKPTRQRKVGLVMGTPGKSDELNRGVAAEHHTNSVRPQSSHNSAQQKDSRTRIRPHTAHVIYSSEPRPHIRQITGPKRDNYPRVRPQTAQPYVGSTYVTQTRPNTAKGKNTWRCSSLTQPRRPKSAPPKYELIGRSPAVPKRTIVGILAEMQSRCAATREMVGKSKELQKYIASLAWAEP